jgi:hypothetical protein
LKKNYLPIETNLRHKEKDEEMRQSERLLEHEHNEEMKNNTTKKKARSSEGDSIDNQNRKDHDMNQSCDADSFVIEDPVVWIFP